MKTECPKCGYIRKDSDQAPGYECPECGIVYAKYIEKQNSELLKRQRDSAPQPIRSRSYTLGKLTDWMKSLRVGTSRKLISKYIYAVAAILIAAPLIYHFGQANSQPSTTKIDSQPSTTAVEYEIGVGRTKETITVGGLPLDNPDAIAILQGSCVKPGPTSGIEIIAFLYCEPWRVKDDPNELRQFFDFAFKFGNWTFNASFVFSESGTIDYAEIKLPQNNETASLISLLKEKYGVPLVTTGGYIDPAWGLDDTIPGITLSWRDRADNEILILIPGDLTSFINRDRTGNRVIDSVSKMATETSIKPKIYIHSGSLVKKDGRPSYIVKGMSRAAAAEQRKRAWQREEVKDRL